MLSHFKLFWRSALDVLFLHPNFPGQFKRLANALTRRPGVRVWGLGADVWMTDGSRLDGVTTLSYPLPSDSSGSVHPWAAGFEKAVRTGEQVLLTLSDYKKRGFEPDVVIAHPGWGDAFFVRDFFPGAKVIGLFEYFYRARGADVGFDPEFPSSLNDIFRLHAGNATQLLALESCDVGVCPTQWQRSRFPDVYQSKLSVLHEGVDTQDICPDEQAVFQLPDGKVLHAGQPVLTYVSRHLEPYRGFHVFMRALPAILAQNPDLTVVIIGNVAGTSYGAAPKSGGSWKDVLMAEVGDDLPRENVHFLGWVNHADYLKVLQVSAVHVYMTYPFVLSWSCLEAMSAGCLMVASDTAPVREVIEHEKQGFLFDFLHPEELVISVQKALMQRHKLHSMRKCARESIVDRYDFERVALPGYLALME